MGMIKAMKHAASTVRRPVERQNPETGEWEPFGVRVGWASIQTDPDSLNSEHFSVVQVEDQRYEVVNSRHIREVV